ncbi:hypothetical protein [Thalassospira marina]|nr:hypothetical protein [Thalassospira marina]
MMTTATVRRLKPAGNYRIFASQTVAGLKPASDLHLWTGFNRAGV